MPISLKLHLIIACLIYQKKLVIRRCSIDKVLLARMGWIGVMGDGALTAPSLSSRRDLCQQARYAQDPPLISLISPRLRPAFHRRGMAYRAIRRSRSVVADVRASVPPDGLPSNRQTTVIIAEDGPLIRLCHACGASRLLRCQHLCRPGPTPCAGASRLVPKPPRSFASGARPSLMRKPW